MKHRRLTFCQLFAAFLAIPFLVACTDVGLSVDALGRVAVVAGDFDFVEEVLDNEGIGYTLYHGYISEPVYPIEPGYRWDAISNQVEGLLENRTELSGYNTVFINCGTRGIGRWVYNGVERDDKLVANNDVVENLRGFVLSGGRLYLSDWSYDLIEAAWPGRVQFYGDERVLDAAQAGHTPGPGDDDFLSPNLKKATIVDNEILEGLQRLGEDGQVIDDTIRIAFDQEVWAVAEEVATEADGDEQAVRVLVRGAATVDDPEMEGGTRHLDDVPLMFEFEVGSRGGKVLFTSFHNHSQVTDDVTDILKQVILGFKQAEI